ncbi:MAG: hypothetical protein Q8N05_17560, partial [Bacteroidota bacterium]|nr:hypothetical protein [Bacteroidota bacterium]
MTLRRLLLPAIAFIVIITSCGKDDDLTSVDGELTAKPSMTASLGNNSSDKTKLNVPVVTTTVTGTTVVVSWEAIPNAVGYHVVFGDIDSTANSIPSQPKVLTTSVTISNLTGGIYKVKVKALAANGSDIMFKDSPFSNASSFTVGSVPPVVEVVKTKLSTPVVTTTQISYNSGKGNTTATWGNIANASSYTVTLNGNPVSSATSPLSLTNLEPGTYVLAVTAVSGATNYLNSDPGTTTIIVKDRRSISTPVISGNVTYTSATAGSVSVTPLFIWPPNNKLTTVTFVGTGTISTGTGTINASHTTVTNATSYVMTPSTLSNLAPGTYTVAV